MPTGEARRDRHRRQRAKMGETPLKATGAGTTSGRTAKTAIKINPCEIRE